MFGEERGAARNDVTSHSAKAKSDSEDNKIYLLYPFDAEQDFLENACKNLTELGGMLPVVEDGIFYWREPDNIENTSSVAAAASASDDNGDGVTASVASAPPKATDRTHYITIRPTP